MAVAALTAGVTPAASGTDALSVVKDALVRNVISQGVKIAVGVQDKFEWQQVAVAGVAAGITEGINALADGALGRDDSFIGVLNDTKAGEFNFNEVLLNAGRKIIRSGINHFVEKNLFGTGKFNFAQVAADAFGNALGEGIVGQLKLDAKKKVDAQRKFEENQRKIEEKLSIQLQVTFDNQIKAVADIAQRQNDVNFAADNESRFAEADEKTNDILEERTAEKREKETQYVVEANAINQASSIRVAELVESAAFSSAERKRSSEAFLAESFRKGQLSVLNSDSYKQRADTLRAEEATRQQYAETAAVLNQQRIAAEYRWENVKTTVASLPGYAYDAVVNAPEFAYDTVVGTADLVYTGAVNTVVEIVGGVVSLPVALFGADKAVSVQNWFSENLALKLTADGSTWAANNLFAPIGEVIGDNIAQARAVSEGKIGDGWTTFLFATGDFVLEAGALLTGTKAAKGAFKSGTRNKMAPNDGPQIDQDLLKARNQLEISSKIDLDTFDFGAHLRVMIGGAPKGMIDPHAHHVLFKRGLGEKQQILVREGQDLLRKYEIDPILGAENLAWAPNRIKGQHDINALKQVVDTLKQTDVNLGTRKSMVNALKQLSNVAAQRR